MHTPLMMTNPRSFCSRLLRVGLLAFASLALAALARAAPIKLDLPAQPLPASLQAVAQQAEVQVLFSHSELKDLQAPALAGSFEPFVALNRLLEGSGYVAVQQDAKQFIIRKATAGSVRGVLLHPDGGGAAEVNVALQGLGLSAVTNENGAYFFPAVPVGTHVIVAQAEGFQPLHLKDVEVSAGREVTLKREIMRRSTDVTNLDPYVVSAESVTALGDFEVTGQRARPFIDGNADIPRTINDVQPYYIYDAKTLEGSGATNVEDFLKQRLSMNTMAQGYGGSMGNTFDTPYAGGSQVNLRGVGSDKTLVLVDGRRIPSIAVIGNEGVQGDLNGIPLSAIDRIEVMPSSASGIYGGNAIGGVVNVILKRNYQGGEVRAVYDNAWDNDSPKRTVSASYGFTLEGGRTKVMLRASWRDVNPMILADRSDVFGRNYDRFFQNVAAAGQLPTATNAASIPGPYLNISGTANLVLKNGGPIGSRTTFIPAGTSPTTPAATLAAGLRANAGQWSYGLIEGVQSGSGRDQTMDYDLTSRNFGVSVRREMRSWLEAYVDFSYESRRAYREFGILPTAIVSAASPVNPFTSSVTIRVPNTVRYPNLSENFARNFAGGLLVKLPADWLVNADYTYNASGYKHTTESYNVPGFLNPGFNSGLYNPFVDLSLYPLPYTSLPKSQSVTDFLATVDEVSLRAAGPLPQLPWGEPRLVAGLQYRTTERDRYIVTSIPATTTDTSFQIYFPRTTAAQSAYTEVSVPLLREGRVPLVHALEAQVAARTERYTADTGTNNYTIRPFATPPPAPTYSGPTRNGQPIFAKAKFDSTDYTFGLKYQPTRDITVRASRATAFLPPTISQLSPGVLSTFATSVLDRRNNNTPVSVFPLSGGNPDLIPQNSESTSAGVIWLPSQPALKGLRINLEYNRIKQFDFISALPAQTIVDLESLYPNRVTRDANGVITTIDTTNLNLYQRDTDSLDFNADYQRRTSWGTWNFSLTATRLLTLKSQYALTSPAYEAAGFSPNDLGAPKNKGVFSVGWEKGPWNAVWTASYTGGYIQAGAPGSPTALQNGAPSTTFTLPQGGFTIPSQTYHDAVVGYTFAAGAARDRSARLRERLLSGITLQVGVRNVFDKVPPFDAAYISSRAGMSGYGDYRLRSYWLSVKKAF